MNYKISTCRLIISCNLGISVFLPTIKLFAEDSGDTPPRLPTTQPAPASQPSALYRLIQRFDFNERPLGNYEETPMHWVRLTGPGLPGFCKGQFDDTVGRQAPPSFHLSLLGGNVVYEYQYPDPVVVPESDYTISGYIRAAELKHARAFIAAYLVDRFGQRIAGSERVSNLAQSTGAAPEPWQRVELFLSADYPNAVALRLQLWLLQTYAWRDADAEQSDPIVRRDVRAEAWFDDITVYQLPRARLSLSNPTGLIFPNHPEALLFDIANTTGQTLLTELTITDAAGRLMQNQPIRVPPLSHDARRRPSANVTFSEAPDPAPSTIRIPVPPLQPGLYQARLRLQAEQETLLERKLRFAVLAELPTGAARSDFGVDLGRLHGGDTTAASELLQTLHCAAVKVGVPMVGALNTPEKSAYFRQITELLHKLLAARIETTGVIVPPNTAAYAERLLSTRRMIETTADWPEQFSPVLAQLGSLITSWQLGEESIELNDPNQTAWPPALLKKVREQLVRFVTVPEIVIPQSALDAPLNAPAPSSAANPVLTALSRGRASLWVPAAIPARALPRQLEMPAATDETAAWLRLEPDNSFGLDRETRLADLGRRVILAKALAPARIYVPAPFELSTDGGSPAWQPTEEYLVLRTLFHALSGKQATGLLPVGPDAIALIFEGRKPGSNCLVAWTWRGAAQDSSELYLGPQPMVRDLWAVRRPLETREGRTRLPLKPLPQIIEDVDVPLARLQAGFSVAPTQVQANQTRSRTTVTFPNPYDQELSATLEFEPPAGWKITPAALPVTLAPGQVLEQSLELSIPHRQAACTQKLAVRCNVHTPEQTRLEFTVPFTIELQDIAIEVQTHWAGDDLIVEQSLHNRSAQRVSFSAFCQPPTRSRLERDFLNISPGESVVQTYLLRNARSLMGSTLHMGVQEIRGPRSLDQLVEVPP